MGPHARRARAFAFVGRQSRRSALALAAAAAGCTGLDYDANPFYVGHARMTGRGEESRMLAAGPFWDDARTPDRRETALHPLWRRVETSTATEVQVLDPLYASRTTYDEASYRFLALSWARKHSSGDRASDYDFMLFPLLFFGHGATADENYFALIPLYGTIKSFAGFAEVFFVLFPLYYQARKEISSPETFHSITPFLGWIDGGPRDGSWHLLPLAGHWKYAGKYDKWSVLWPFVHWQRNRLDTDDPTSLFTFWPLFGIETGPRTHFLAFLWPFFRFRSERVVTKDEQGLPHQEVYYRDDFLWPLYQREHTREFDHVRLFPFYARYQSRDRGEGPELTSQAFAIPLFWLREVREKEWTKSTFDFVPLIHTEEKSWRDGRPADAAFKLWPLYSWKREAGGDDWKVPALLPLDAERYTADFEANWEPLVELWHAHRDPNGDARGNALFRLVDWDAYDDERRFSLPLLFSARWNARRWRSDLLLGLLRLGGGSGGAELRLLGLPLLTPEADPR